MGSLSLQGIALFVGWRARNRQGVGFFIGFCVCFSVYLLLATVQDYLFFEMPMQVQGGLKPIADWVSYFAMVAGNFSVGSLFGFTETFPDNRQLWGPWPGRLVWLGLAVFVGFGVTTLKPIGSSEAFWTVPPYFGGYSLFLSGVILIMLINFGWKIQRCRASEPGLPVVGAGLGILVLGILVGDLLFPAFNHFEWTWVDRVLANLFALSVFVAVTQYKLFRIRTAVHYTLYWIWSSAAFGGILLVSVGGMYRYRLLGDPQSMSAWVLMASIVSLLVIYHLKQIQPRINRYFFRRQMELNETVGHFQNSLSTLATLPAFVGVTTVFLKQTLFVSRIGFVFRSSDDTFTYIDDRGSAYFPISATGELTEEGMPAFLKIVEAEVGTRFVIGMVLAAQDGPFGVLLLTEMQNLREFDFEDVRFLKRIIPSLSVYLKNAVLYDTVQAKRDELETLQHQLVEMQSGIPENAFGAATGPLLTAGVLHEVKNTHLAMGGLINQILEKKIEDPAIIDEILKAIGLQSEYLYLFSKNLLYTNQWAVDSSPSTVGSAPVDRLDVSIAIEQAIRPHALLIRSQGVDVVTIIETEAWLNVDSKSFHLLLSNLIHNAAKYGGKKLEIIVRSEGPEPEVVAKSSHFVDGVPLDFTLGVGLNICKKIMSRHQGKLWVDVAPDTFLVTAQFGRLNNTCMAAE